MNKISILFALILLGITAVITQVVLIRELIVLFSGNELSIGIILANWLVLEATGSYLAGRWATKQNEHLPPYVFLQWLLAIVLPFLFYLTRALPSQLNFIPGEAISITTIFYLSFLLLIPIGLINGAQFSVGCNLLSILRKKDASLIGRVYSLEAVGSIIGGVVATYVCLKYLNSIQTAFFLSLLNVISALLLSYFTWDKKSEVQNKKMQLLKSAHLGILLFLLILLITGQIGKIHRESIEKLWPDYRIVSYENSIFGNVSFLERSDQWHLFSNGVTVATLPTPDISQIEDLAHFPMLLHPEPKDVFLLGGGVGGIINELIKYNITSIDYAELDPLLIQTVLSYAPDSIISHLKSALVNTKNVDGRFFLRMNQKIYDVIILNLPDPSTLVLNRYYTYEFFELCHSRLKENGILVFQIPGSSSYMNEALIKLTNSLITSASKSFRYHRVLPFEHTLLLFSDKDDIEKVNANILSDRLALRGIKTRLFSDLYIKYKLDSTRVMWFNEERKVEESIQINRDLEPIALYYDLVYLNSSLSPSIAKTYAWFENFSTAFWMILIIILYGIVSLLRHKNILHPRSTIIMSVFSTGLFGMGLTIIFLLTFQSFYGYIYYWIGLIISAFMLGLSGGGLWGSKDVSKNRDSATFFFYLEETITLYLLLIIVCIIYIQSLLKFEILYLLFPYIILFLTFVCGVLVGVQFPHANKLYLIKPGRFTQTAGAIYATDLLGAWAGGILFTLILIPIVGTIETVFILFIMKLATTLNFKQSKI